MKIVTSAGIPRHYMARAVILLVMVALIAGMAGCGGNDGTVPPLLSQSLQIRTWYDLDAVRDNLAGNHTLMNDLDAATPGYEELAGPSANGGKGWEPIATSANPDNPFTGTLNGRGYEIRDLYINRPDETPHTRSLDYYVGLFGFVREEGVIKDISVVNVTAIGHYYVGGLVGKNYGTVSNCTSTGTVAGNSSVGGLIGGNTGNVSNSYSTASVTAADLVYATTVGGLVGDNWDGGTVCDSYSTGNVTGHMYVGGLLGVNAYGGVVSDSYSTGNVTGDERVGGLVGVNYHFGYVNNSYYNYDEVLINGENIITVGALFNEDFEQWLASDKFLDVNGRLSEESGYYLINDVGDFKQLLAFGHNATLKFRLTNDLDLGDEPGFYIPYLAAEFDGNDHKTSNLSVNLGFVCNVGLFGYLAPGGNVTHMSVENIDITGHSYVGGVVGCNHGTVGDCYSTGSVAGAPDEGAIGGLVGWNYGTVSNSHCSGSVSGEWNVGGLVGNNHGTVSDSHCNGDVIGIGVGNAGGLVGANGDVGTVSNSYSTASVTSHNNVGGLVGETYGIVSSCYSGGEVTGDSIVGGLAGSNYGIVRSSYSTASVSGNDRVGGLVGVNKYGDVYNSYCTGSVTGGSSVGGLAGDSEFGRVRDSFWDIETSGQATSDGGTGKTTAEMKDIATFSGAAWDIVAVANASMRNLEYIWNIVDHETYPFLSWQP